MSKPEPPEPPNPRETAAGSTSTNVGTAVANAFLGNVDQNTPYGTLRHNQTGSYNWNDPYTGQTYNIPRFTSTTTLSPAQQRILGQTQGAQSNIAGIAQDQSAFIRNYLKKPFTGSNKETEARLFDLGRRRLDPMFKEQQAALDQKLADQGIAIGSKAYETANKQRYEGQNDAYNQLLLTGNQQAFDQGLSQRNQPINEIMALLSGSQVSHPQWAPNNMPNIPTTDVAGLINTNYDQRMGVFNQQNAQRQNLMGGLFGLGGSLLSLSDRRAKKDIEKVGKIDKLNVYRFRYKGEDGPKHLGLMAQEVEKVKPDAVVDTGSLKLVDYGKALLEAA